MDNDLKPKVSRGLVFALVVVAAIVLTVVVIPVTKGITRSGDLGLGDGIVGGGTLLLAAATAWLGLATYRVDERSARREQRRLERDDELRAREVMGVARLMTVELEVAYDILNDALRANRMSRAAVLPHASWDRSAEKVVATLSESDALAIVTTMQQVLDIQRVINKFDELLPPKQARIELGYAGSLRRDISFCHQNLVLAREVLKPMAFPDASRAP